MQHWIDLFNTFVSNQSAISFDSGIVVFPLILSILFGIACSKDISRLHEVKWNLKKFVNRFGAFDSALRWTFTGLSVLWLITAFNAGYRHDKQANTEQPQLVKTLRPKLVHGTTVELIKPDGGNPQFIFDAHTNHGMIVSGELLTTHGDVVNDPTNIYLDLTPVHNYTPSNRMQKVVPPQTVLHYLHGLVKKADVNDY